MSIITFTGVDHQTPIDFLRDVSRKYTKRDGYPAVEFGILRSPKAGQSPRYPNRHVVERITDNIRPANLAFHLCGEYARMVHELRWSELNDIIDFNKVGRVQVNSSERDEKAMITLARFSMYIGKPVIMQWGGDNFPYVPGVDLLFDRSGGRGIAPGQWPSPEDINLVAGRSSRIGYAGGLSPTTLPLMLESIVKAARRKSFWLDCETGVRTNDLFDPVKVQAMIDHVTTMSNRITLVNA